MNTATRLVEAREQLQTPVEEETSCSSPVSRKEFDRLIDSSEVTKAIDSIASAKALFTTRHIRNQIKLTYNALNVRQKGMCCIAGGLSPHDCHKLFDAFNDIELQKIRRGLQELGDLTRRFDRSVGGINKLKPADFH